MNREVRQGIFGHDRASALFDDDGIYRYDLTRTWFDDSVVPPYRIALFVMLNPSTADAQRDDPTIRRCVGFSQRWSMHGLVVVNLYALRASKPRHLLDHPDAVGPENERTIEAWLRRPEVDRVIAAWGAHPLADRSKLDRPNVEAMALEHDRRLWCLGRTASGAPRHPLYVRGDATLEGYDP